MCAVANTSGVRVAPPSVQTSLKPPPCQLSALRPLPADSAGVGTSALANTRAGSADRWAGSDLITACTERGDGERTALSAGVKAPPGTRLRRLLRTDRSGKRPRILSQAAPTDVSEAVRQQLPNGGKAEQVFRFLPLRLKVKRFSLRIQNKWNASRGQGSKSANKENESRRL